MKRRISVLLILSILLCVSIGYAENVFVINMGRLASGGGAPPGDPCSCPTSTYQFCYTGDYIGDPNVACVWDGSYTLSAYDITADICNSSYIQFDNSNEYVYFNDPNLVNDTAGTIFFNVKMIDKDSDSDIGNCLLLEIFADADNRIIVQTANASNAIQLIHEGQNNATSHICTDTITFDPNIYRVGVTWTTASANPDVKISCVRDGNPTHWVTGNVNPTSFDVLHPIDDFCIGEKDSGITVGERAQIWDVIILPTFDGTDPDP